jgi:hypothetical protein
LIELHGVLAVIFVMVPSARLELAQLSPLPPQDSVSTNFTTTALISIMPKTLEDFVRLDSRRV